MRLGEVIEIAADRWPERIALAAKAARLSFGQLNSLSTGLAKLLCQFGATGKHVAVLVPNSLEYAVAYFAIAKAGGVIVPLAPAIGAQKLERILRLGDVELVLTAGGTDALTASCCNPLLCFETGLVLHRVRGAASGDADSRAALMMLTSGTSGERKFVMLSDDNVTANMRAFLDAARLQPDSRALIALPLTSAGTNTTEFLAYISSGITANLYSCATFGARNYCGEIKRSGATVANVTPFILNAILSHPAAAALELTTLRSVFCASSPLSARTVNGLAEFFPWIDFHYGYGLTEASPRCTMLDPASFVTGEGSAGISLRGVEVRVTDEEGLPVAAGTMGEIQVRGPNVMLGYYRRPDETAAVLRGGWLRTGDLGRMDVDSHVYVSGRRHNRILTRGYTVSPEEIEEALLEHNGVEEAQAIGVPDEMTFQKIVAYVVQRPGHSVSAGELQSFLAGRLASYQRPREFRFVGKLVRGETQKLLRHASSIH